MSLNDESNGRKGRKRGQENNEQLIFMEETENRNNKMFRGNNDLGNLGSIHQGGVLLHQIGNTHPVAVQHQLQDDDDSEDDDQGTNQHVQNNNNFNLAVNPNQQNIYDNQVYLQQLQQQQMQQQQIQYQQQPQLSTKSQRKSRRKPPGEICGRSRWTEQMDAALSQAVEKYGNQWREVAMEVGFDKNSSQCHKRWTFYINPALESRVKGPWSDDEIEHLRVLVENNGTKMTARGIQEAINWTIISKELNREYFDCKNKYKLLMTADMLKGPFSEHEDNLIAERVREWANRGNGLWCMLEKELNRRADSVKLRAVKLGLIVR